MRRHNYNARYYHALLGRFINRDPIVYLAGSSLYAYVGDSPLNATDPSGMKVFVINRELDLPHEMISLMRGAVYGGVITGAFAIGWAGGPIGAGTGAALGGLGAVVYVNMVAGYYQNNTWHCILVVSDECTEVTTKPHWWSSTTLADIKGVDPKKTFDFQADIGWTWPAKDFAAGTWGYARWDITTVVGDNSKDKAVLKAAKADRPAGSMYVVGGSKRYNCCDWLAKVLRTAGVAGWKNPNPEPFGPNAAPLWVPSGLIGKLIDEL